MKPSVADRETKLFALRIEARDGTIVRFAQYPHDIDIGGNTYLSGEGTGFSNYSATASLSPSTIDLEGTLDAAGISRETIEAGIWNNAKCYLFATSWANPVEDEEPIGKFFFGEAVLVDERYQTKLVQLVDALNQSVGRSHGPLCTWTLFDETLSGEIIDNRLSKCRLDINDFIVTGTITDVTSNSQFSDSGRTEGDQYFTAGAIRFTTGLNAGLAEAEIKQSLSDGSIVLFLPFHFDVEVGDEYEMIPGCLRRRDEDCMLKYNNAVNFGGFPDLPDSSSYQQVGSRR